LFADSIRASSPNRLRQQAGQKTAPDQSQHVNLPLATREPSTEDVLKASPDVRFWAWCGHRKRFALIASTRRATTIAPASYGGRH
jgi:hypothetical protein